MVDYTVRELAAFSEHTAFRIGHTRLRLFDEFVFVCILSGEHVIVRFLPRFSLCQLSGGHVSASYVVPITGGWILYFGYVFSAHHERPCSFHKTRRTLYQRAFIGCRTGLKFARRYKCKKNSWPASESAGFVILNKADTLHSQCDDTNSEGVLGAGNAYVRFIHATSASGVRPKKRLKSRLNCEALS